jgi:hypothetical protein
MLGALEAAGLVPAIAGDVHETLASVRGLIAGMTRMCRSPTTRPRSSPTGSATVSR